MEISEKEIEILNFIVEDKPVSQRKISNNLGLSLGLVNLFLKKLASKGLIKIKKTTNQKSLKYILTSKGFSERLNYNLYFLKKNIKYFSNAKETIISILSKLTDTNVKKIYICGVDDWAELIYLAVCNFELQLKGFVDFDNSGIKTKFGVDVLTINDVIDDIDADIVFLANYEFKNKLHQIFPDNGKKLNIVFF